MKSKYYEEKLHLAREEIARVKFIGTRLKFSMSRENIQNSTKEKFYNLLHPKASSH
jgi:hypothetical protein